MNTITRILSLTGVAAISGLFVFGITLDDENNTNPNLEADKTIKETKDYNVYALGIPANLNFAGEQVPLNKPDIRERVDRELLVNTYWQSNGLLLIKRSRKYFPIIEPILKKYKIPNDFKYLAVIESGLTQAVSPARAVGFWQILKSTGKELGLEVNSNVDERYHIEKATEAACMYLNAAKARFGSWTLAAAAYNAGNAGINRYLTEQKVDNYYDLLLGQETGRYVFRIIAMKQILENPENYGFNFEKKHLYQLPELKTFEVDSAVTSFPDFAKKFDITYKELKLYNPWLREQKLNNDSGKKYYIDIPQY